MLEGVPDWGLYWVCGRGVATARLVFTVSEPTTEEYVGGGDVGVREGSRSGCPIAPNLLGVFEGFVWGCLGEGEGIKPVFGLIVRWIDFMISFLSVFAQCPFLPFVYGVRVWSRCSERVERTSVMAFRSLSMSSSNVAAYLDICPGAGRGWLFGGESCVELLEVEFAMAAE